jgi:microcystin-dependent protein
MALVSGNIRKKVWFFIRTAQGKIRGTRFLDDDKPTEATMRDLIDSVPFKDESTDQAQEDSTSNNLSDKAGLVVASTSDQAKSYQGPINGQTLSVQPHQLPESSDETGGITVGDANIPDYSNAETIVEVEVDAQETRRNNFIIRATTGFRTWLGDALNNIGGRLTTNEGDIDTLETNQGDLADLTTTDQSNLVAAINEVKADANSAGGDLGTEIQETMPLGSVIMYANTLTPNSKWVICNGQAISRATYADLFALVGTTFGAGDGTTTFNVPDTDGRLVAGYDSGDSEYDMGDVGGTSSHTITNNELPRHHHPVDSTDAGYPTNDATVNITSSGGTTLTLALNNLGNQNTLTEGNNNFQQNNNIAVPPHIHTNADFAGVVGKNNSNEDAIDIRNKYITLSYMIKALA